MKTRFVFIAMAGALACAACGFKGPLYLPQQNAAVVTHPAPAGKVVPAAGQTPAPQPTDKKQPKATPPSGR